MEDWIVAWIVIGIIAVCIIITIALAQVINKSDWKSRYQKKVESTQILSTPQQNPMSSPIDCSENSQQTLPYPSQNTAFPPVGFESIQPTAQNGIIDSNQSVFDPSCSKSFFPSQISTNSENIINKTRL